MTVGVVLAILCQDSLSVFVNLHSSDRGVTGTKKTACGRRARSSPSIYEVFALLLGHAYTSIAVIIAANRHPYGPNPSRERKWVASVRCLVVSIVSWSKTANGRSLLILGQVFSSFCTAGNCRG